MAPQNFISTDVTATSITFQWNSLPASEANGVVRYFIVTCTSSDLPMPRMVSELVVHIMLILTLRQLANGGKILLENGKIIVLI